MRPQTEHVAPDHVTSRGQARSLDWCKVVGGRGGGLVHPRQLLPTFRESQPFPSHARVFVKTPNKRHVSGAGGGSHPTPPNITRGGAAVCQMMLANNFPSADKFVSPELQTILS